VKGLAGRGVQGQGDWHMVHLNKVHANCNRLNCQVGAAGGAYGGWTIVGRGRGDGMSHQKGKELAWRLAEDGNTLRVFWQAGREAWA
jgi:hypothetical protein